MSRAEEICVLGHVTRDLIRGPGAARRVQPGGAAYYAAAALARLGLPVRLVTKLAARDRFLLDKLEPLGIAVTLRPSAETTAIEIDYSDDPDRPAHEAVAVAGAFDPSDLRGIAARAVVMDPLVAFDGFPALMRAAARAAPVTALDLQGWVNKFFLPGVSEAARKESLAGLAHVRILKAGVREAARVTGKSDVAAAAAALAALGPREVIVSRGGAGSYLLADGEGHDIPAFAPEKLVDPTGAGDSYLAAYVAARLEGREPREAARFAAALAALKVAGAGPFAGTREDVDALVERGTA